jgi:ABC-type uncharacterized transport system substrate-binding protein
VGFAEGDPGRYPQLAKELGALKLRVIVTVGYLSDAVFQSIPDVPVVLPPWL